MNAFLLAGIVVTVVALGEVGRLAVAARRARTGARPVAGIGWLFAGFSLAVAALAAEAAVLGTTLAAGRDPRSGLAALVATLAMAGGVAWIDRAWEHLRMDASPFTSGPAPLPALPAAVRDRALAAGVVGEACALLGFGILLATLAPG